MFETVARERYISLTTFRLDGTAVATPVWFAADGPRLLVWTSRNTWKVRRVLARGEGRIAACDVRGRIHGPSYEVTVSVLDDDVGPRVQRLLRKKYGLAKTAWDGYQLLRKGLHLSPPAQSAFLEITATKTG